VTVALFPGLLSGAEPPEPDSEYRYRLWRNWGDTKRRCLWVMLNPSKANADNNDPTVTRCINFSRRWGFGALDVANMYAYRSTYPKNLWLIDDPIGPGNDEAILKAVAQASRVVLAWGANARSPRDEQVQRMILDAARCEVGCLGYTPKTHKPNHPLMMASVTEFERIPA